ncbi:MAG: 1,4-alpha-glucan branching protein GlgB [Thermoanaerobaculia bacterium]
MAASGSRRRGASRSGPASLLTKDDLFLFGEGSHLHLQDKLGSHPGTVDGVSGTSFGVWAPNAAGVSVMGEFNGWNKESHPLARAGGSGVWEGFLPGVGKGTAYKFHIVSRHRGYRVDKADPFAFRHEVPPRTGSVVWDLEYEWGDAEWMADRAAKNSLSAPMAIYEVHAGSWRRVAEEKNRFLTYRELAPALADYVVRMGFTHVELLPVMEHPYYASWGYQTTGYFAPTSRYGTPQDFMYLVDYLHRQGIGVILDWVPSHFPSDEHGLVYFDGTHLYEHADPRQGYHPDWHTCIFNYGRGEVRSFLLSSALYWLERYHADGLRVDAVASMLRLDYSRKSGEWIPNRFGGPENLEAIVFLRRLNEEVYGSCPGAQTMAEESTTWPMVSRPTYVGGLGFGMKWDLGWMHDTLEYLAADPIFRKYEHNKLTFRMIYAASENYLLPLSHDEVVHGKYSLADKMPGDAWNKMANLRLLLADLYSQPGKKLLFMGGEFGQWREWSHDRQLDWELLEHPLHRGVQRCVEDLNRLYRAEPALHELDEEAHAGFEWVDCHDADASVVSFLRKGKTVGEPILAVFNFTPIPRPGYRVGVPRGGIWRELLDTDAGEYGGSGQPTPKAIEAVRGAVHGRPWSLALALPPLAALFFKPDPEPPAEQEAEEIAPEEGVESPADAPPEAPDKQDASS